MSGLVNKLMCDGSVQLLGTIPGQPGSYGVMNVVVINPSTADTNVTIWLSTQPVPSNVDLIAYRTVVPANGGRLEEACRVESAGERCFIQGTVGLVARLEHVQEI